MAMQNLLEGIDLPVTDDQVGPVCRLLVQRLNDHAEKFEIERSAAQALLGTLRRRCKHPGTKSGYNERDGHWRSECPICLSSE